MSNQENKCIRFKERYWWKHQRAVSCNLQKSRSLLRAICCEVSCGQGRVDGTRRRDWELSYRAIYITARHHCWFAEWQIKNLSDIYLPTKETCGLRHHAAFWKSGLKAAKLFAAFSFTRPQSTLKFWALLKIFSPKNRTKNTKLRENQCDLSRKCLLAVAAQFDVRKRCVRKQRSFENCSDPSDFEITFSIKWTNRWKVACGFVKRRHSDYTSEAKQLSWKDKERSEVRPKPVMYTFPNPNASLSQHSFLLSSLGFLHCSCLLRTSLIVAYQGSAVCSPSCSIRRLNPIRQIWYL